RCIINTKEHLHFHLYMRNADSPTLKQYSTSASGVGKGYSHGWCSAVATRPEAGWRSGVGKGYSHGWCAAVATRPEAEWRRQQHPWEYPLPTPLALVLYCLSITHGETS